MARTTAPSSMRASAASPLAAAKTVTPPAASAAPPAPPACRPPPARRRPRAVSDGPGAGIVASPRTIATIETPVRVRNSPVADGAADHRRLVPHRQPVDGEPVDFVPHGGDCLAHLRRSQELSENTAVSRVELEDGGARVRVVARRRMRISRRPVRWVITATRSPPDVVNSWRTPTPGSWTSVTSGTLAGYERLRRPSGSYSNHAARRGGSSGPSTERQAARRRPRARGRADAGAALRAPSCSPGSAPRSSRSSTRCTASRAGRRRPAMTDPEGRTVGATFLRNNLGKRSVGIDLKSPEGRELVPARWSRSFDVVAENFKAGTMDRLGLGYDDVAAVHPAVDLRLGLGVRQRRRVARTATGRRTRRSSRRCRASTSTSRGPDAAAGDRSPSARSATSARRCSRVIGVLAALRHRDRTGRGPARRRRDVRRDGRDDRHRHQLLVDRACGPSPAARSR